MPAGGGGGGGAGAGEVGKAQCFPDCFDFFLTIFRFDGLGIPQTATVWGYMVVIYVCIMLWLLPSIWQQSWSCEYQHRPLRCMHG